MIATMALGPLIAGSGWWWLCAFIAAGILFSGLGLRALRTPPLARARARARRIAAAAHARLRRRNEHRAHHSHPGHLRRIRRALSRVRLAPSSSSPCRRSPCRPLTFALAFGVGILAVLTDILVQTLRMPALAAAPALVPLLVPGFIIEAGAEVPTLVLTAAAYLLLLRVDVRVRRRARLASQRAAATSAPPSCRRGGCPSSRRWARRSASRPSVSSRASVLAASTPSISTSLLLGSPGQGTLFARGVSPFIDLGRDLRRPEARPAHSTTSPATATGRTSRSSRSTGSRARLGRDRARRRRRQHRRPMPRPTDSRSRVRDVGASDRHRRRRGPHDVAAGAVPHDEHRRPERFMVLGRRLAHGAAASTRTRTGSDYRVPDSRSSPRSRSCASRREVPEELAAYLALPDEMPADHRARPRPPSPRMRRRRTTRRSRSRLPPLDRVRLLDQAPVDEGYDGGGFDVIAKFLESKSGYCVHFASTMAVLARDAGHPRPHLDRLHAGLADRGAGRRRAARRGRLARPALVARAVLRGRRLGAVRTDAGTRQRARLLTPRRRRRSRRHRTRPRAPPRPARAAVPSSTPTAASPGRQARRSAAGAGGSAVACSRCSRRAAAPARGAPCGRSG